MRFLIVCLLACLGALVEAQTTEVPSELLDAGHCVATARGDWFDVGRDNPYTLELGYVSAADKSSSDNDALYLIHFTTRTHSQGFVFAFATHGKGSRRELMLESRTRFQQTVDGTQRVELVNPPLGGVGSQDEILSAIQEVGFHTWKVPVADLRNGGRAVACRTAEAVR